MWELAKKLQDVFAEKVKFIVDKLNYDMISWRVGMMEVRMVNTFENPVIAQRLDDIFSDDETAKFIAKVIDGLIGKSLKDIDDRTKHLVNIINHHFDDSDGRIVKIEGMLEAISKELDIGEDGTRLDRMEGQWDNLVRYSKRRRKVKNSTVCLTCAVCSR